jgi:hypothetical protein
MAHEALGRVADLVPAIVNGVVNNSADVVGNRVALRDAGGVTIVVLAAAGTAGDDLDIALRQHTAASGGTTAALDVIDHYYYKTGATLTGAQTWQKHEQPTASTIIDATGGAGTSAEQQQIVVIEVDQDDLDDGFTHVSVVLTDAGAANDKRASALYLLRDLQVQRAPQALRAPQ